MQVKEKQKNTIPSAVFNRFIQIIILINLLISKYLLYIYRLLFTTISFNGLNGPSGITSG